MTITLTHVVVQPGYATFALAGTDLRAEIVKRTGKRWRWRAWHALGPVTIDEGVERLRSEALLAVAQAIARSASPTGGVS